MAMAGTLILPFPVGRNGSTPSTNADAIDIVVNGQSGQQTKALDAVVGEYTCTSSYWNDTLTETQRNTILSQYANVYVTED